MRRLAIPAALLFALSCRDTTAPEPSGPDRAIEAHADLAPMCDVSWAGPVSGLWSDPTKWDLGRAPGSFEHVCITVPGTYSVLVDDGDAARIEVGDGVSRISLIELPHPWSATQPILDAWSLNVNTGATVQLRDENDLGSIDIDSGAVLTLGAEAWVRGMHSIDFDGTIPMIQGRDLHLEFDDLIISPGSLKGTVSGDGRIYLTAHTDTEDAALRWESGSLGTLTSAPNDPIVVVRGFGLFLTSRDGPVGAIELDPDGTLIEITGTIPSEARVRVRRAQWNSSAPVALGYNVGSPLDVEGTLEFVDVIGHTISVSGSVDNRGVMILGPGRIDLGVDTLRNSGSLVVSDSVHMTGGTVINAGTLAIGGAPGDLVVVGGTLLAEPTGSVTGTVSLTGGGRLRGTGSVARVVSTGGIVSPGGHGSPLGSLSLTALTLDATSRVVFDVGGSTPGTYDQLTITGNLVQAGTFEVQTVAPFVPGHCGQVVSLLTLARGSTTSGAFAPYVGLSLSPSRAWRPVVRATSIVLAGYDPSRTLSLSPGSVAVSEGGASVPVNLCLGGCGPASTVNVVATPRLGQAAATPNPLVFSSSDWALPKVVNVQGIDDTVAEPAHVDTVRFRLNSADPNYSGVSASQVAVAIADNDAGPDLTTTLVSSPVSVNANQVFEARYQVTNNGPAASSGSTFSIAALAGMTWQGNTAQVSCASSAGTLSCTVGALAAGAQVEFVVVYRAGSAGSYANTVRIAGLEYDAVPTNDTFMWNLTVN